MLPIATMRSPGCRPASQAGLPCATAPISGAVKATPARNTSGKTTSANSTFITTPPDQNSARCPTDFDHRLCAAGYRSSLGSCPATIT